jgi:hypothetical protein
VKRIIGSIGRWLSQSRKRLAFAIWLHTGYIPVGGAVDVTGQRSTGNIEANVLEPDFANTIAELEPSKDPLTVLTRRLNKDTCINPKFTWFEDKLKARFDTINNGAGYSSTATSIVVTNGGQWAADDLLYVTRTGEVLRVTAVSTNTLTVLRGVGSTAAALVDTDEILNIGSAAEEGALDKPAGTNNPTEAFNYTQIFRRTVDETKTARSTANRTSPNDWARQLNHEGIEHYKDIEYAALLGRPSLNTSGTNPRRTTGGFVNYATQNSTDVGGAMTEQEFFDALRPMFRYGSGTKLAMCAAKPVDIINAYPRAKLQIVQGEETFGLRIMQVVSPHGNLNLVTHWLLEGAVFANQIWVADLANVGYRYLHGDDGGRDTHMNQNIQANGADGRKDEYLTECGFKFALPLTHGKIVNITS